METLAPEKEFRLFFVLVTNVITSTAQIEFAAKNIVVVSVSVRRKEPHVFLALLNVNQNHLLLFIGSPIFTASVFR
jgi:hypothetical protein